jgi:diaminopimelate epimerase
MIERVRVSKLHGARNDFIVLDARLQSVADPVALARRLCDRHDGIGADGLLIVSEAADADAAMRIINPDGSEAEMCGNGIRCVARFLDEHGEGGERGERNIATVAGIIHTSVLERGETYQVRVEMGVPHLLGPSTTITNAEIVDVGNLHVVGFGAPDSLAAIEPFGIQAQHSAEFPNGVNLHLGVIEPDNVVRVRHYERGAGLTMACGTGAVAAAAVAIARGLAHSPVTVIVPGGELMVEIGADGRAFLTGPAVHAFDATVDVNVPEPV